MSLHRILIVDDQRSVRQFIASLLRETGSEIETLEAENGVAALAVLERCHSVDLILSDVDMPVMNGLTLCAKLKEDPRLRSIPVIMVSSFDSDHDVDKGFQAGAFGYISKAEVHDKLVPAVRTLLHKYDFRKRQTIMVVDDSASIRTMLTDALGGVGFQVMTAENGLAASEQLALLRPDLIISDINMPELDGYGLLHWLHAQPELKDIPFVAMSFHNEMRHISRMVEQGAAAYLTKPFNMAEMLITIERILSSQFQLLLKEREKLAIERNMLLASITSLINALEARDAYTKGHSLAVAKVVAGMAQIEGLDAEAAERLVIAAQLHDIGKIGIRDQILLKKEALNEAEYEAVKAHPIIGSEIIAAVPSLQEIVPVVRSHHERYDGMGYPEGLRGEAIPLLARMIAVADTYDAMISSRPYRNAFVIEETVATIREVRGSQLCPHCVDLFLTWLEGCPPPLLPPRELA